MARVVVTGGAGFLGSHLCRRLLTSGIEVVCLDNLLTGREQNLGAMAQSPDFELQRVDVSKGIRVDGRVDAVLHFASPASPTDYLRLPIETLRAGSQGTFNALELAKVKQARFLLASTSETYGDPLVHPQPEDYWGNVNPVGPRAVYDEAKRFSEAATSAYRSRHGVNTAIVRIFNTYGPGMRIDDGRAVPTFIYQALHGLALTVAGDGSQTRSLCYADDLIEGIELVLESDQCGPVNLGNPHEVTILELATTIIELTGSSSQIDYIPRPVDDPGRRCPDIALARHALGWEPSTKLREGLERTIAWFVAQGSALPTDSSSVVRISSRPQEGVCPR